MTPGRILVYGKHPEILNIVLRLIRSKAEWQAEGTSDRDELSRLWTASSFDLVLLGGGVPKEEETEIRNRFYADRPEIPVIQHFGGGSGLLFNEIEAGLAGNVEGLFWVG